MKTELRLEIRQLKGMMR